MQVTNGQSDSALRRQFEELQERAAKDALSGLLNRATAEAYIKKRLEKVGPEESCAMFIVDLDNFKGLNDTLGHQAGDQAICQAAGILSGMFRATDIVGRLGGDEFIVFLSGRQINDDLVRRKGKEICQRLQLSLGNGPTVTLTASVGIHVASGRDLRFEGMYQSADLALYKAKKNGKHGYYVKYTQGPQEDGGSFLPVSTIPITGLLENLDSGVALLEMGEEIRLIYVSPSFCRIMGVEPQSYELPRGLESVVHPDDLSGLNKALRDGLATGQPVAHVHRVSGDGKNWFWWHIRAVRIDYSNVHPVMLVTTTDISRFMESEQRLQEINQRLQSAFEQTTQGMWEVDVPAKKVTLFNHNRGNGQPPVWHQGAFPQSLISGGWIHPNSVPRFMEFAQQLLGGRMQGYGNFVIQHHDTGCYGWAALSYRLLCDDAGRVVKAVGIIERLSQELAGQQMKTLPRQLLPEHLNSCLTAGIQADLTMDAVTELWVEGKDHSGVAARVPCSQMLSRSLKQIFSPDDRQAAAGFYDRNWLLERFHQGERWLCTEYRWVDGGGDIRWVTHVAVLMEDPVNQHVCLFAYLLQERHRRQWETRLGVTMARDPVTGLFDQATSRALVESLLGKERRRDCVLGIIKLVGLEQLYALSGEKMNNKRRCITTALSVGLGPECVVGQYSRDKLLVFFPDVRSKAQLKTMLESAFAFVRITQTSTLDMESLRFVAGLTRARQGQNSYVNMVAQCVQLCQLSRNSSADTVTFYQEKEGEEDWAWSELQRDGELDQITVHQAEMSRPLTEGEKEVALQCVSAMLAADGLESSLRSVLGYVGAYYRADRVYILALAENRQVVTMPFEWTGGSKPSIQQAMSGMQVARFPILQRCMEERCPLFLSRTLQYAHTRPGEQPPGPWHFTVFPLNDEGAIVGFLCVENAKTHPADAALFSTLLPHILGEHRRFRNRMEGEEAPYAFLNDLPNLRSYLNVIHSINSDIYSSLGAVCVDIPGLSSINSSQGFEYGDRLLWYVSKTLADIFGRSFLFRTWDAEFVALCPDTTRQVFVGRCTRLRSVLQRRYPRDLRIGYTWADGVFQGKSLVDEARSIMHCEQVEAVHPVEMSALGPDIHSAEEAARLGRFTVFLQPKVHMTTGRLIGAEALVRGLDQNGNLVTPDRFIRELEQNGDVRNLDLFVLERTLALMDHWRELELQTVPVSVNFSRFTLFDPTAPASVLAIQSRFPKLSPGQLEIEVTESAGNVDNRSLAEVLERFRSYGLHFSLDDFGSQYANLSIFTNVRFDSVKLDRSLIADLTSNVRCQMLIRDLVSICHTCNMICVAEGVETQAQIDALSNAGCAYGQGYFFDRPIPADVFQDRYLHPAQA